MYRNRQSEWLGTVLPPHSSRAVNMTSQSSIVATQDRAPSSTSHRSRAVMEESKSSLVTTRDRASSSASHRSRAVTGAPQALIVATRDRAPSYALYHNRSVFNHLHCPQYRRPLVSSSSSSSPSPYYGRPRHSRTAPGPALPSLGSWESGMCRQPPISQYPIIWV